MALLRLEVLLEHDLLIHPPQEPSGPSRRSPLWMQYAILYEKLAYEHSVPTAHNFLKLSPLVHGHL